MTTIIAKNQTAGNLTLAQLDAPNGVIPASGQVTLTDTNNLSEILNNSELLAYINAGDVILNDGSQDFTQSESVALMSSALQMQDNRYNTVVFQAEYDNGNSGTSVNVDWRDGQKHFLTLTDNTTITFDNPFGTCNLSLRVKQDATGGRSITWPVNVKWPGGVAPTITSTSNAVDIISFYYDGTDYYGVATLDFS